LSRVELVGCEVKMPTCSDVFNNASLHEVDVKFRELVIPKVITRDLITSYIRKALRSKAWFTLSPYQRALLKAITLSRVEVIRGRVLKELVTEVLAVIEKHTFRGRAIWYGLLVALSMYRYTLQGWLLRVESILYLGISYLSNPPIFRYLG